MDWKNRVPNLLLRAWPLVMFMTLVGKHLRVRFCVGEGVRKLARCYLEVSFLFEGVATQQPCRQVRRTQAATKCLVSPERDECLLASFCGCEKYWTLQA